MTTKPIYQLYFRTSVLLTVIAAVGQSLLYFLSFDCSLYLYERGPMPTVLGVFVLISLIFMFSYLFAAKKEPLSAVLPAQNRHSTFAGALAGFFILATLILSVLYYINGLEADALSSPLAIATTVISVPAACYFFVTALNPSPNPKSHAILGCFLVIWMILYTLTNYFHMEYSINSPLKIYNQLALLAAMFYILQEVRYILEQQRPIQHRAFGFAAMFLLTTHALPALLLTFALKITITSDTIYYLAELALALYIFTRLDACAKPESDKEASEEEQ